MIQVPQITKNVGMFLNKNSPHILTGLGCAGLISTAVLSGVAAIKANDILKEYKNTPLPKIEMFKLTWKLFIPAGIVGLTSIGCILGANTVNTKRNAALAALYSLSETAFRDYKTKVVEKIGANKETKIRDEINRERIIDSPIDNKKVIVTGNGDVLCYDKLSDRYFTSSYETIRQKVNDLNYDLRTDMWMSVNQLYYQLGLPDIPLGEYMGFDIDKGQIEVDYSTQLSQHGQPCLVIDVEVHPKYR